MAFMVAGIQQWPIFRYSNQWRIERWYGAKDPNSEPRRRNDHAVIKSRRNARMVVAMDGGTGGGVYLDNIIMLSKFRGMHQLTCIISKKIYCDFTTDPFVGAVAAPESRRPIGKTSAL